MKKLILALAFILLFSTVAIAIEILPDKEKPKEKSICPVTKMSDSCLTCHTVSGNKFRLKEFPPDSHLIYPIMSMQVLGWETGQLYGYYRVKTMDADDMDKFLNFLRQMKIKKAVLEIYSGGGSLFSAQKIVSLMETFQSEDRIVETKINGAALSAAFYIFVAGTPGYRYVHPYAELMWHELQSLTGFGFVIDTPSSAEEKSRVLRYLQDNRNEWLASKGKLTKEELDEKVKNREWWMTGRQALEMGFADKLIEGATK